MSGKEDLDLYLSATTDIYEDIYKFGLTSVDNELEEIILQTNGK